MFEVKPGADELFFKEEDFIFDGLLVFLHVVDDFIYDVDLL